MYRENLSSVDSFLILGFSDVPKLQVTLFCVFLSMYLATLAGNLLIIAVIYSNSQLHTPMYFFITNLSFIDLGYTAVIFPNMLAHFFSKGTNMLLSECVVQIYFYILMIATEYLLLTVMAYDRYVAICNPLNYTTIMNIPSCIWLAAGCWIVGFLVPLPHTIVLSRQSFCESHIINHYFCDLAALMKLSCTNTNFFEMLNYLVSSIMSLTSFSFIIISYVNIISAVFKLQTKEGRQKAFSTCASHLTVVIIFYGSLCATYLRPISTYSIKDNKLFSLSHIAVTPLCNPIVYGLKNADFKKAIRNAKVAL